MPREKTVPGQIAEDVKLVRRIKKLADLVVDDSHKCTEVQRQFRRLIIQACLGYEYGCCYVTKAHAEVYDSANHAKEYE